MLVIWLYLAELRTQLPGSLDRVRRVFVDNLVT